MSRVNEPASPVSVAHGDGVQTIKQYTGLTIREEFIKAAMTGLLASRSTDDLTYEAISRNAIKQADQVLHDMEQPS